MALRQRLLLHARETITFGAVLGIVSKFTPARSPQSNDMVEALFKALKRDFVFSNDRPDAETVRALLPGWCEDYNENTPHKALRMLSPCEFIRSLHDSECPVWQGATPRSRPLSGVIALYLVAR